MRSRLGESELVGDPLAKARIIMRVEPLQRFTAEEIATDYVDGLLSRRATLRRLALMGLGTSAATALIAACGDRRSPAPSPPASGTGPGQLITAAAATRAALQLGTGYDVVNVMHYGATGDGTTDDSDAIEAAWEASEGNIYFPPGSFIYNGSGLGGYINTRIVGAGSSRKSRVFLGDDSYLVVLDIRIDAIEMSDLEILNGKGAIKHTWTGQNVNHLNNIRNVRFRNYAECAIASDAADMPYWRITDCVFWGLNTTTTIGIALSGLTDGSVIDRCSFVNNRVAIKMRKGGNNAHINRCDFIHYSVDASNGPRVYVWTVPTETKANSGAGFVINECRIGNENKAEGDKVVVYADELPGTSNGTRMPNLDADSTGWILGHQIFHCALHGNQEIPVPLIYSTTPNVEHLTVAYCTIKGQPPSYILEFRTPSTVPDRGNSKSLFGPFTGEVETEITPSMPMSNAVGSAFADDPNQMLQTRPDVIRGHGSGTASSYRELLAKTISQFSVNLHTASTPRTDSLGGTDAALLTFSTAETGGCTALTGPMTVGVPVWVEFDVNSGDTGTPLEMLRVTVADATGNQIHWRRVVAVPGSSFGWVTYAFSFTPRTVGNDTYLLFDNRANGTKLGVGDPGTVIVGRPRVYHSNERQLGGRRPIAPAAATTLSDAQSLSNELRNALIAVGVISGTASSPAPSTMFDSPNIDVIQDANGANSLVIAASRSAVNYFTVRNRAAGSPPSFEAQGADTNIGINFATKGSGQIFITVPTGQTPELKANGVDADIDLKLSTRGTGVVMANGNPVGVKVAVPASASAAGVVGQWAADSSWIYVCTATNTWRRTSIATW